MADVKISDLPASSGMTNNTTDYIPVVQGGITKRLSFRQLVTEMLVTTASTNYTLSDNDKGKVIYFTSATPVTVNCVAGLGAANRCTIIQGGAGKVTVAPNGQTLVSRSGLFSTAGQYAVIDVVTPVANTFLLSGDLGA
jgi:hypothetical protein